MKSISRWSLALVVGTLMISIATAAEAQQAVRPSRHVISANPFGLLVGLFNVEYERKVSESATAGVGGSSTFAHTDSEYVNADMFYRYYPSGQPLEGWAFGVKMGMTRVTDEGSSFGFGFDSNWSSLMGKNDNFYVGVGFGLKRLFGTSDSELKFIPTVRIINIGFAF